MVIREIKSQASERVDELVQTIEKSLTSLGKLGPTNLHQQFDGMAATVRAAAAQLRNDLYARIDCWIRDAHIRVLPIEADHARSVVEAYFTGGPPFKNPKSRDDFPDAFVWQSLIAIAAAPTKKIIHFISNDHGFQQHCQQIGVRQHKSILGILESGELPITAHPTEYDLARRLKQNSALVAEAARHAVHDVLPQFEFPMPPGIAKDTNAGPFEIEHVLALKDLVVDGESIALLGNRTFAIPFTASLTARASFRSAIDQQGAVFNILEMERCSATSTLKLSERRWRKRPFNRMTGLQERLSKLKTCVLHRVHLQYRNPERSETLLLRLICSASGWQFNSARVSC